MAVDVFSVPVFLIVFRESLETVIIVAVLLAFLKQTLDGPNQDKQVYKKLVRQVWFGVGAGLFICLVVAGGLIGAFYTVGVNNWESTEMNYEGAFSLIASVIISVVGAALLRIGKMQEKWRVKLAEALEAPVGKKIGKIAWVRRILEKYAIFILPFITVLREGIEAIIFVAGVTFGVSAKSVPLPVVVGLIFGIFVGYLLYKGGATAKLQWFLVFSTCLLYLVGAGLFSRSVWYFEQQKWNDVIGGDAAELGNGPGSYDISKSVWHVNCCSPELNGGQGGWGIFNAILGWQNSATYGSVISYNVYWIVVISGFVLMRFKEVKGHYPFMAPKNGVQRQKSPSNDSANSAGGVQTKNGVAEKTVTA